MKQFFLILGILALVPAASAQQSETERSAMQRSATYLTNNPYLGSELSQYDSRVSPYSYDGAQNPYTTGGGRIYAEDGTYLGRLNSNQYDPESVSNPYGRYGSRYSSESINNPYGQYGSPYSSQSPNNPYSTTPPKVIYDSPFDN